MIKGYATPEETGESTAGRLPAPHEVLGATLLRTSQAGFGCYRVSTGVKPHEEALKCALLSGVNLIDTSANYTDGGSESLVGQVLEDLIESGALSRQNVIVVSKGGYLQGQNYELSRQRREDGRPFPDLVEYAQGLEHCIHPEFLEDQLTRSLRRLNLRTLDVYLLHNPEYYLGWVEKNGAPLEDARKVYYGRIRLAFEHLEKEVERGRIRFYGISSNTFPSKTDDPQHTSLETVWGIAESISSKHHFRTVQFPLNILEPGAVLEKNQTDGRSVLKFAAEKKIGVLINRPLNAFGKGRLIRLAEIEHTEAKGENEIIQSIGAVSRSEAGLSRGILPGLAIQPGLKIRIKEQVAVADGLKHYWRNFGSYEKWRQVRDGNFKPRVQGVLNFLGEHAGNHPDVEAWLASHKARLETAYEAVGSIYAEAAGVFLSRIGRAISGADPDWEAEGTISQKAFRAVRSTRGVSCVLIGMRKAAYVKDVLEELQRPVPRMDRLSAWETVQGEVC